MRSERRRPDSSERLAAKPIAAIQSEEFWQEWDKGQGRYLGRRERTFRARLGARASLAFVTLNLPVLRIAGRWLAIALGLFVVLLFADWIFRVAGWRAWVTTPVVRALEAAGLPRFSAASSPEALIGLAAVQIAGITLPLFYTVLGGSLRGAYESAPESLRNFALSRPYIRFFETPAWTLGVWGIALTALAEAGHAPGLVTGGAVAALAGFVIVAIPLSFWRMLQASSPWRLAPDMSRDVQATIGDVQREFETRADPEVLAALRRILSRQLRLLLELSTFVARSPIQSQISAQALAYHVNHIAAAYRAVHGRIPANSEWHEPKSVHASVFAAGGATGPEAAARIPPAPAIVKNQLWVQQRLAALMKDTVLIAAHADADDSVAILFAMYADTIQEAAASGAVDAAIMYHEALTEAFAVPQISNRIALVMEDRAGSLFSALINGLAETKVDCAALATALHTRIVKQFLFPQAAGPQLRSIASDIRKELDVEYRIERALVTPTSVTVARLEAAHQQDVTAGARAVLDRMQQLVRARVAGRPKGSKSAAIPLLIQAYHALSRLERKLGDQLPPAHVLDNPRYKIKEHEIGESHRATRRLLIDQAVAVLVNLDDLSHEPSEPDLAGLLYYFTALELVHGLTESMWPDAPNMITRFLATSQRFAAILIDPSSTKSDKIARRDFMAAVSVLREGLRVAGYAVLLATMNGEKSRLQIKTAVLAWFNEVAKTAGRTPQELVAAWATLLEEDTMWNFKHQDNRFNQDNDVWDELARRGFAHSIGSTGYGATPKAAKINDPLLTAVSRDPGELVHEMDAVLVALLADWLAVNPDNLSDRVRETHSTLHAKFGKYGGSTFGRQVMRQEKSDSDQEGGYDQ